MDALWWYKKSVIKYAKLKKWMNSAGDPCPYQFMYCKVGNVALSQPIIHSIPTMPTFAASNPTIFVNNAHNYSSPIINNNQSSSTSISA